MQRASTSGKENESNNSTTPLAPIMEYDSLANSLDTSLNTTLDITTDTSLNTPGNL